MPVPAEARIMAQTATPVVLDGCRIFTESDGSEAFHWDSGPA
jgi:hypothetical protein